VKLFGHDLYDCQHKQGREKNSRAGQVAGHGDSVTTSLTKRRGKNFYDPKTSVTSGTLLT
jgi:hypothetical protein